MLRQIRSEVGILWCNLAHDSLMWPVHGQYECRSCGRRYPAFGEPLATRRMNRRGLRQAMPLVMAVLLASAAHPAHAARAMKSHADMEAEAALRRYIAAEGRSPWGAASLEIHASLPRFEKTGAAMAIRRAIPIGEDRYQLLDFGGDPRVRAQLIVRYLNAEGRIAEMPLASVAITPANYRFTFKRRVDDGEREPAYVFEITPRRKRDGLIKGELWLGQQTGALIRQSGYLVKCPSVSAGRVAIIRDDTIRDGTLESRRIHIKIEGGSIGGAELVIEEHPLVPADTAHVSAWQRQGSRP